MIDHVTLQQFGRYFAEQKLGDLRIDMPLGVGKYPRATINASLDAIYRHGLGYEQHQYKTLSPDGVEAIVLYGSALHLHTQFPTELHREKPSFGDRFLAMFTGEELAARTWVETLPKPLPTDVDVMVIAKQGALARDAPDEKIIKPLATYAKRGYGRKLVHVVSTAVSGTYERTYPSELDWTGVQEDTFVLPLNIVYRSVDAMRAGIGHGDEWSEDVVRMGIPIIGASRFAEIVKDIPSPVRAPLHRLEFSESIDGTLQATLR